MAQCYLEAAENVCTLDQQKPGLFLSTPIKAHPLGLHDFEKMSNCNYLDCCYSYTIDWHDKCYIIILIFIEKQMIVVLLLKGSVPTKDGFLSW